MEKVPDSMTVAGLRQAYRAGTLTPRRVLDEVMARVQRHQSKNIFISAPEEAKLAAYLNILEQLDFDTHPLWGIPFVVKDNIDVEGFPTTAACPDYAYRPGKNATVVQRLVDAGAIPVGKANLDQFATGLVGMRSPYGAVHNAWRDELISGGSSSGSAVSVALGICAFSLGTDTAGSGRVPAALNGLFGFKPSCGAWPIKGVVPACVSLDCVTVFAHTMEDCLAVDDIARGIQEDDPWSKDLPRKKAGVPKTVYIPDKQPAFFGPFAREYEAAWEKALETISHAGFTLEKTDVFLYEEAAAILYEGPWVAERWADLGGFVETHSGKIFSVTEQILRNGERPKASELFQAIHRLQKMKRMVRQALADAILLMPTAGGTWTRQEVDADPVQTNTKMGQYTNHCNLLDLCACSYPVAMAAENLPFGITAFARSGEEDLLASFAKQLFS